ncbi:hypothetical protein BBP40_010065 [Aspergillus hancockii]|nr:hypothetical protein BBP40_010065 [Aspergillus hancockii]
MQRTGNMFNSSLVAFTAILVIHPRHLTLAGLYNYTSSLAAILWVSRLLLLEYALPVKPYHFINDIPVRDGYQNRVRRAAVVHYTFGVQNTFYPLEEILRLTTYEIYQMYHEHLIHTTTDFFNRELLLGYREEFTLADLADVPSERRSGFSFLDVAPHPARSTCTPLLLLCQHPPSGVWPLRQISTRWDIQAMRLYEHQLVLLIQNTATSQRNIFLSNGQVMIVTEYHKTRRRTARTHPVARFLPPAVGRLLVTYLVHVRPMLVVFNRQHPSESRGRTRLLSGGNLLFGLCRCLGGFCGRTGRAYGIVGCITPCGISYTTTRGGPLCGLEAFGLQGLPIDRLILARETQNEQKKLHG